MRNFLFIVFSALFFISCLGKNDSSSSSPSSPPPPVSAKDPVSVKDPGGEPPALTKTPPPGVSDPLQTAGKVSLWKRSAGYDAAVFLPADYGSDSNKFYPLVLSLHGLRGSVLNVDHTQVGGKKTGFIKQVWDTELANSYPGIVIAPDESAPGTTATNLWSHAKLRELIIEAKGKYQVDPDRIVVTGLSAGSIGAQELLKYSKDLIAAAMPGAYKDDFIQGDPCVLADVPVWVFGNSSDSLFESDQWKNTETIINACSNAIYDFTLTVYYNYCGHGCWDAHWSKPEVQQWLVNQIKQ